MLNMYKKIFMAIMFFIDGVSKERDSSVCISKN